VNCTFRSRLTAGLTFPLLVLSGCNLDPNYAKQQYLNSGNKYFDRERYKEALIMYRKAIAKDAKFGPGYYHLALTYDKLGEGANSIPPLRRAVELLPKGSPEWNDAALRLSEFLIEAAAADSQPGRAKPLTDEVEQIRRQFESQAPGSFENYRLLGDMKRADAGKAIAQRDAAEMKAGLDQAIQYYRQALEKKPRDASTSLTLARSLALNGDLDGAQKVYRGLIDQDKKLGAAYVELYRTLLIQKKSGEAEEVLKRAITNNPNDYSFQTLLAGHYFEQKDRVGMERVLDNIKAHAREFPQAYMTAGDFYGRIGESDKAIREYQEGQSKDPSRKLEYDKRIVDVLLRQGKRQEAESKTAQMLKDNPKDAEVRGLWGNFLLDKGDVNQAMTELQSVIATRPDDFLAHFNLGRAFAAKGDFAQAAQQYQASMRARPDFVRARVALAEAYIQQNNTDGALKIAEDTEKMSPGNPGARLMQAEALLRSQKFTQAKAITTDLVAKFPRFPQAQIQLGAVRLTERDYAGALEAFQKAYELDPSNVRALMGQAEVYFAQNQPDKALSLIEAQVKAHPDKPLLAMELAGAKVRAGQLDGALNDYKGLLARAESDPAQSARVESAIAQIYIRKSDGTNAIAWMEKARQHQPSDPVILNGLAQLYEQSGRKGDAEKVYRAALAADPNNPSTLNNLAFILAEQKSSLNEALTLATRAKQRLPNVNEVSDTLGYVYLQSKMTDQAVSTFRDLTGKSPDNPTFRYHYCMALYQKGDKESAKRECNAALARKPQTNEASSVRELLAKM
jgi:tetratricopeptide (TPR) repeat protein